MKILLLKPTVVNGEHKQTNWEGEVSFSDGSYLVSIGKAKEVKDETEESVEVSLAVDVTNTEAFEDMKKDLEEYKGEATRLNNEIETLKQAVTDKDAEIATLKQNDVDLLAIKNDITNMTLKDLREKYPAVTVESTENEA